MQTPSSRSRKVLPQIARQVIKKSGAARMNFILSGTASVAMKWMIGSRPKRSSEETRLLGELRRKQSRKHEIGQLENDLANRHLTDRQSRLDAPSKAVGNGFFR